MNFFNVIYKAFYKDLDINFNEIDLKKLLELKTKGKKLNRFYTHADEPENIVQRYCRIMEMIHTSYKGNENGTNPLANYAITNTSAEKLLLYMLSVDPELEALIIYNSCNTRQEIKEQMTSKFGVYDSKLAKIETHYVKRFLSTDKQNKIIEEIERRVYK